MIVVYAQGGGLGHLTRVRAALHTLGRTGPVTILTSSRFASDPRVVGDAAACAVPHELARDVDALRAFVRTRLHELRPTELIVDAFPDGLVGELDRSVMPAGTPVVHLARRLRWRAYLAAVPTPADPLPFDATHAVEPLDPAQRAALAARSAQLTALALEDPPPTIAADPSIATALAGAWLVVHSGSLDETTELVRYARDQAAAEGVDPAVVVLCLSDRNEVRPARIEDAPVIDVYPAWPHFAGAGRIFTAGGFNAMRQAAPFRERHRVLPFPRRFDDQFERARRAGVTSDRGTIA